MGCNILNDDKYDLSLCFQGLAIETLSCIFIFIFGTIRYLQLKNLSIIPNAPRVRKKWQVLIIFLLIGYSWLRLFIMEFNSEHFSKVIYLILAFLQSLAWLYCLFLLSYHYQRLIQIDFHIYGYWILEFLISIKEFKLIL